jgi:hypothetical protein
MPEWVGAHTILWASKKNVRRAAVRCSTLKAVASVQTAEISASSREYISRMRSPKQLKALNVATAVIYFS